MTQDEFKSFTRILWADVANMLKYDGGYMRDRITMTRQHDPVLADMFERDLESTMKLFEYLSNKLER